TNEGNRRPAARAKPRTRASVLTAGLGAPAMLIFRRWGLQRTTRVPVGYRRGTPPVRTARKALRPQPPTRQATRAKVLFGRRRRARTAKQVPVKTGSRRAPIGTRHATARAPRCIVR